MGILLQRLVVLLLLCGLLGLAPARARQQEATTSSGETVVAAAAQEGDAAGTPESAVEAVEIAFAIDFSGSMGDMLGRASLVLDAILAETRAEYPGARRRYGLIYYGDGVRRYAAFDLTDDEAAFRRKLSSTMSISSARDEYFGAFVNLALTMKWSPVPDEKSGVSDRVVRRLYVIGNESARQGPAKYDYRKILPMARAKGITVSTVYCSSPWRPVIPQAEYGDAREYVRQELIVKNTWVEAAELGGGQFYQLAYGLDDVVAFTWDPKAFWKFVAYMDSDEYLANVVLEQNAHRVEKYVNDPRFPQRQAYLYARREANASSLLLSLGVRALRSARLAVPGTASGGNGISR